MANLKINNFVNLALIIGVTLDCKLSSAGIGSSTLPVTTLCEFYNRTECVEGKGPGCNAIQECEPPEDGKRNHCFVLWSKNETSNGNITISLKVNKILSRLWVVM
jgi:hypothetical protein